MCDVVLSIQDTSWVYVDPVAPRKVAGGMKGVLKMVSVPPRADRGVVPAKEAGALSPDRVPYSWAH